MCVEAAFYRHDQLLCILYSAGKEGCIIEECGSRIISFTLHGFAT